MEVKLYQYIISDLKRCEPIWLSALPVHVNSDVDYFEIRHVQGLESNYSFIPKHVLFLIQVMLIITGVLPAMMEPVRRVVGQWPEPPFWRGVASSSVRTPVRIREGYCLLTLINFGQILDKDRIRLFVIGQIRIII